jgi:hypothetical protein
MYIFPYETKIIEEGKLVDPRVTLEILTKKGFLAIKFLVDSGADVTSLPLYPYSQLFEFRKDPKQKVMISGVEGKGIAAYPFKLKMRLGEDVFSVRSYFIESFIDPLLGRLDLWNLFSITFDNKNLKTILTPL